MKLLCWMHRKFRQNSHEALKALVIGQSSVDDQQYFPKPSHGIPRGFKHSHLRKSFTGLDSSGGIMDDDYYEAEEDHRSSSSAASAMSELFHGFLAIGTLGSDQLMTDPATPTFAISVENIITEKETEETTEGELKLINDELEKELELGPDDSVSSRNSHVSSNARSSHGSSSVITLGGEAAVCPLQGYLFGSAIEMSETTAKAVAAAAAGSAPKNSFKESNRTSLGELFQRSKIADEYGGGGGVKGSEGSYYKEEKKDQQASAIKKLKKKMLRSSTAGGGGGGAGDSSKKLHKILQMFHRKVHPETSVAVLKNKPQQKPEQKKKTAHDGNCNYDGQIGLDEDATLCPQRALFLKQKIRRYRSQSNPPHFSFATIDSFANREQWIRTDADYLVLEL